VATYYEIIHLIERLHRLSLEVLKLELDRLGVRGINSVQGLILYSMGRDQISVRELTLRGYYLGSNVSYNLKRLVDCGYLLHERSPHDRRSVHVRVTSKGAALQAQVDDFFKRSSRLMPAHGIEASSLTHLGDKLYKLESFWSSAHIIRNG
jgi:DNA-binding MarR family transcriptional regulator